MTQAETITNELTAEDLNQVVGGITDGTSNLTCRKAGGTQQDATSGGESSIIAVL